MQSESSQTWIGCGLNPIAMNTLTEPAEAHLSRRREFKTVISNRIYFRPLTGYYALPWSAPTLLSPNVLPILSSSVSDPSSLPILLLLLTNNNKKKKGGGGAAGIAKSRNRPRLLGASCRGRGRMKFSGKQRTL